MLKIVIKKPMLVTMVSAEPTYSFGAVCAVSVENWGESPAIVTPHIIRITKNIKTGASNKRGENRQHNPEIIN